MRMNNLEKTAWDVFNLQDFEQNKIKFKQRSIEDFIGISFVLIDADLLLIWMNNSQHCFCFHVASCPVLPAMLIISQGECINRANCYQSCQPCRYEKKGDLYGPSQACSEEIIFWPLKGFEGMFPPSKKSFETEVCQGGCIIPFPGIFNPVILKLYFS